MASIQEAVIVWLNGAELGIERVRWAQWSFETVFEIAGLMEREGVMAELFYRAKWLFPVLAPPMKDAWIRVEDGIVAGMGAGNAPRHALDLGNVAVLPALVNAHAHLEFSSLTRPIGRAGMPFPEWIAAVVQWRRGLSEDRLAQEKPLAIETGLRESWSGGVGLIGEIATTPWNELWYAYPSVKVVAFHELIGLSAARRRQAFEQWQLQHDALRSTIRHVEAGISPHAPYTIGLSAVHEAARIAKARCEPITMHLAESADEMQLLESRSGPFRALLEELGAWSEEVWEGVSGVESYLEALSVAERVQVVHGNFLNASNLDYLATHRDRFTLVHCPRTHAFFQPGICPVAKALKRGVRIALGTDSRASNPDLDLWQDVRAAAAKEPNVDPELWLKAVTYEAAYSLGKEREFGALVVGRAWNPCVIELPDDVKQEPDLALLLFESTARCRPLSTGIASTRFS